MKEREIIKKGAQELGVLLDNVQVSQFIKYLDLLMEWNKTLGLLGALRKEEAIISHFLDSLSCAASNKIKEKVKIADIGAGAGFPGIPLKITFKDVKVVLVDPSYKKTWFMTRVIEKLGLKKCEILRACAEDLGRDENFRESFDVVVARALSPLPILAELALPLAKVGGFLVLQKGKKIEEELKEGKEVIDFLGGVLEEVKRVKVPSLNKTRHLVIVRKQKPTPLEYPRKAGIPKKRPLFVKKQTTIKQGA